MRSIKLNIRANAIGKRVKLCFTNPLSCYFETISHFIFRCMTVTLYGDVYNTNKPIIKLAIARLIASNMFFI